MTGRAWLRAADCDLVALGTIIRETVGAMAEARKTGWGVDFMVSQAGYAAEVPMLGRAAVEGLYGVGFTPIPYFDEAGPELQGWMTRYRERFGADANIQAVAGYIAISVAMRGLENAGRDLTVDGFVAGLERIQGYTDIFGTPPVEFGPERRLGARKTFLNQVRDGRWVRLTEPLDF